MDRLYAYYWDFYFVSDERDCVDGAWLCTTEVRDLCANPQLRPTAWYGSWMHPMRHLTQSILFAYHSMRRRFMDCAHFPRHSFLDDIKKENVLRRLNVLYERNPKTFGLRFYTRVLMNFGIHPLDFEAHTDNAPSVLARCVTPLFLYAYWVEEAPSRHNPATVLREMGDYIPEWMYFGMFMIALDECLYNGRLFDKYVGFGMHRLLFSGGPPFIFLHANVLVESKDVKLEGGAPCIPSLHALLAKIPYQTRLPIEEFVFYCVRDKRSLAAEDDGSFVDCS